MWGTLTQCYVGILAEGLPVAHNFRRPSRDQVFLLPVDMREWLPKDHFVYFIIELVEQLDLAVVVSAYRSDGKGASAYHPSAMVALLMYAYCDGERSSRRIEDRCRTDVAYRVLMGGLVPDHSTIARFRDRHEQALAKLFVPVLRMCFGGGLGDVSLVAIDGSKWRCPASLRANRTLPQIEAELQEVTDEIEAELARIGREIVASSRRADHDDAKSVATRLTDHDDTKPGAALPTDEHVADEAVTQTAGLDVPDLFGGSRERGQLPDVVGLSKSLHGRALRRRRLLRAKNVLDEHYRDQCADYESKLVRRAAVEQAAGRRLRGRKPVPPQRDLTKKVNVTDPDSRIMKSPRGGYLQGYNAQAAVANDRLNLAPEVVNDENDVALLEPMLGRTSENLAAAGCSHHVGVVVADCGYCTEKSLAAVAVNTGTPVLMSTRKEHKTRRQDVVNVGEPPPGLTPKELMTWKLGTAEGKATYARRGVTVEPTFGHHKHNRRMDFFVRFGLSAADSEWKLLNTVDNIRKLYRRVRKGTADAAWSTLGRMRASATASPAI
jgi:transposase